MNAQGQSLPSECANLDELTPYATVYRYEHVPEYHDLDRKSAYELVSKVRLFVEKAIQSQG